MRFLQSARIWIGCGATDCAEFVVHGGTLTVCSGGRYLNQETSTWVVAEENENEMAPVLANKQKATVQKNDF